MAEANREVKEGSQVQGIDEVIVYSITTTPWGSSPTSPTVAAYSYINGAYTDVKNTVMPSGSPTASGDVITLPALRALTEGVRYRIEVQFTVSGATPAECFFWVYAER